MASNSPAFVDGMPQLALPRPATARYHLRPDRTLDVTYEWTSGIVRAQLTRVPA